MEFREYVFELPPAKGGPQSQHMRFGFREPIAQASALLTGYNASVSAIQIRGARLPDQVLVFSGVEAPPKK